MVSVTKIEMGQCGFGRNQEPLRKLKSQSQSLGFGEKSGAFFVSIFEKRSTIVDLGINQVNFPPVTVVLLLFPTADAHNEAFNLFYPMKVVGAQVPRMTLDELFEQKDKVAKTVSEELEKVMGEYGYNIEHILMVDIIADPSVRRAMNEINVSHAA